MTMDKKYEIIIFWSSEDNAYVAEVPELAPDAWPTARPTRRLSATRSKLSRSGSKLLLNSVDPSLNREVVLRMPDRRCWLHNKALDQTPRK